MLSLGFDPGLCFPAAALFGADGRLVASATLTIGRDLRGGQRLALIRQRLLEFAEPHGAVSHASIEGPSLNSTHREYDMGEGSGAVKSLVWERWGIEMQTVEPARLKLFATKNGNAPKSAVIQYAVQFQPSLTKDDDDEADAIVLAEMAWALAHPGRRPTRKQAEVLRALSAPKPKTLPRGPGARAGRSNNL